MSLFIEKYYLHNIFHNKLYVVDCYRLLSVDKKIILVVSLKKKILFERVST